MRNVHDDRWTELYQSDDLQHARVIATCLSAMEFNVRLCCIQAEGSRDHEEECCPPYVLRVPVEDYSELREVLEEIIDEQAQFDQFMERWQNRSRRTERRLLIAMVILVGGLAAAGAIDL